MEQQPKRRPAGTGVAKATSPGAFGLIPDYLHLQISPDDDMLPEKKRYHERKMSDLKREAAQNQHYVPKFILRNFLSNVEKERVSVFSTKTNAGFTTSIKNIMAERRFYEFQISEGLITSFEGGMGRIEDVVLPEYTRLVEERNLTINPENRARQAMLLAFQSLRTRAMRDNFGEIEAQLAARLAETGDTLEQLEGWEALTPEKLNAGHISFVRDHLGAMSEIIASMDFLLLEAPTGRSFYLSDDPVCKYNSAPLDGFGGNLGLESEGIELYLPLSHNLQLCAWCPSIKERLNRSIKDVKMLRMTATLSTGAKQEEARRLLPDAEAAAARTLKLVEAIEAGVPTLATSENMDFYNSLQVSNAVQHLVCRSSDFKLAKRFVEANPSHRRSRLVVN